MLEQTKILHPNIAVITNVTADHLDRHKTFAEYFRCKKQITANLKKNDWLVVNWDDRYAREIGHSIQEKKQCKVIWFSVKEPIKGYYVRDGWLWENLGLRHKKLLAVNEIGGMPHTLSNALPVIAIGRYLKINLVDIMQACQYQPQKHRIQLIADHDGIAYYNDSKATNIASTLAATNAFNLPICLILCGLGKGQDYHELFTGLPPQVQSIVVFGAIKDEIVAVAKEVNYHAIWVVDDLWQAVEIASRIVTKPGVVLFSPAGSSFDQFKNYEQRGDSFCEYVQKIIHQ